MAQLIQQQLLSYHQCHSLPNQVCSQGSCCMCQLLPVSCGCATMLTCHSGLQACRTRWQLAIAAPFYCITSIYSSDT